MRKEQIEIGKRYAAEVSGKIVIVQIGSRAMHGGWYATIMATGRAVRIRSAAQLRFKMGAEHEQR